MSYFQTSTLPLCDKLNILHPIVYSKLKINVCLQTTRENHMHQTAKQLALSMESLQEVEKLRRAENAWNIAMAKLEVVENLAPVLALTCAALIYSWLDSWLLAIITLFLVFAVVFRPYDMKAKAQGEAFELIAHQHKARMERIYADYESSTKAAT